MKNQDLGKVFNVKSFPHEQENINLSDSDKEKIEKIKATHQEKQEMLITGKIAPSQERIEEIKKEILRKQNAATLSMEPIRGARTMAPAILHSRAYQQALQEEITRLHIQKNNDIRMITGQDSDQEKSTSESFNKSSFSADRSQDVTRPDRERDDGGRDR